MFLYLYTSLLFVQKTVRLRLLAISLAIASLLAPQLVNGQSLVSQNTALRLHEQGRHLFERGNYLGAFQAFSDCLPLVEGLMMEEALYYKALSGLKLNQKHAVKDIQGFIDSHPVSSRANDAHIGLANHYYERKNYAKAADYYGKTPLAGVPEVTRNKVHFRWGYALFNARKLAEALDQFNLVKLVPGGYEAPASYYAGYVELEQGKYDQALRDFSRAETNTSYQDVVPYLIAKTYYKSGAYDKLADYLKKIEEREVMNEDGITVLAAEAYFQQRNYTLALELYETVGSTALKKQKGVLYRAGSSAYQLKQYKKAVDYLKLAALGSDTTSNYAAYYLGNAYVKLNQKSMAAVAYNVVRKRNLSPLSDEAAYLYALTQLDLGKSEGAISAMENYLEDFPGSQHRAQVKELLSQAYINANNYDQAIAHIELMSARNQTVNEAYQKATLLKGQELFNARSYEQAIEILKKSLQYRVRKDYAAEAALWCAESLCAMKNQGQAIPYYRQAIRIGGSASLPARYGLGYAFFNQKQYDQAAGQFKVFLNNTGNKHPYFSDVELRLADCYYVGKNYAAALKYYRQGILARSQDTDYASLQVAQVLYVQGKYDEAANTFDRVLKNYPQSAYVEEAAYHKAQMRFEQGQYAEAIDMYSFIVEKNAISRFAPYAFMRRAASYYNLTEYGKAAADYIKIVDDYTSHPISKEILAPLQEALGMSGSNIAFDPYVAKVRHAHPDAEGFEDLAFEGARNLYFNQDYEQAVVAFEKFTSGYPESPLYNEAAYYLAESLYRMGRHEVALTKYYKLLPERTFSFRSRVLGRVASLEYRADAFDRAAIAYRELALIAGNKKQQYDAWSGLMESYYHLGKYDSVMRYANEIKENGAINEGAVNKASLYLAKAALGKNDTTAATDELLNTVNAAQDVYGAEAKYLLAELLYNTGQHKHCYDVLLQLNNDYAPYQAWVGKSYLLMADNFVAMGDVFQAEATLESLGKFPIVSIRDQAEARLAQIKKENVTEPEAIDSTDRE